MASMRMFRLRHMPKTNLFKKEEQCSGKHILSMCSALPLILQTSCPHARELIIPVSVIPVSEKIPDTLSDTDTIGSEQWGNWKLMLPQYRGNGPIDTGYGENFDFCSAS
eukprot:5659321-Amphidinium_carterae.1